MSGLFTIATNTFSNAEVINKTNGILINDSIEDFVRALRFCADNLCNIDSYKVIKSMEQYRWDNIVSKILVPVLNNY